MGLHINPHRRYRLWLSWYMQPEGRGFGKTNSRRSHSRLCKCILRACEQLLTASSSRNARCKTGIGQRHHAYLCILSPPRIFSSNCCSSLPSCRLHGTTTESGNPTLPPTLPSPLQIRISDRQNVALLGGGPGSGSARSIRAGWKAGENWPAARTGKAATKH
jgi:hypothetical protein